MFEKQNGASKEGRSPSYEPFPLPLRGEGDKGDGALY